MRIARSFFVAAGLSVMLAACGGSGGGKEVVEEVIEEVTETTAPPAQYPATGELAKYAGKYSYCDGNYTKMTVEFAGGPNGTMTAASRATAYEYADCTGQAIGTLSVDPASSVVYKSSGISTVSGAGLPASLLIDKVSISVEDAVPSLSGPGVSGNCIAYPKGKRCYDLSPVTASSPDSALYLANNQLYNLQLQNGVYGVAVVYTRD